MSVRVSDKGFFVVCNGCRMAARLVKTQDVNYFSICMHKANWRPDPTDLNDWLCPHCNGLGDGGPRDLAAKAPLPALETSRG